MKKKVMVTGCFDMLHSGHVAFLEEASKYGELFVCIGNDENILNLKGRKHVQLQEERKYMISALKCVHSCSINEGYGVIDFLEEIKKIQPDIFIVNSDGHTPEKESICRDNSIEYKVLKRIPHKGLPQRSTTEIRSQKSDIPFRLDLAGGWLDQPFVSKFCEGTVVTICVEPTVEFNNRSGMSSSTRNKAIELWGNKIPPGDREQLAKILFTYENPPGTKEISGSQDALGIVMHALNRYHYSGNYWPYKIESNFDVDILDWLQTKLHLISLGPRKNSYNVLTNTDITENKVRKLAIAADEFWKAVINKDVMNAGKFMKESFEAQISMFPNMINEEVLELIDHYRNQAYGWKMSGAGGGGYVIFFSDSPLEKSFQLTIRRNTL